MKIKSQKDFWSGVMFLSIGAAFAWGSLEYKFGSSAQPGPAYFPFALGVMLAILGAFIVFKALAVETVGGDKIAPWAWKPLLGVTAAVLAFAFALPSLGMLVALPALIIASMLAGGKIRWRDAVISILILTGGCWAIFIWGLDLAIPLYPQFMVH